MYSTQIRFSNVLLYKNSAGIDVWRDPQMDCTVVGVTARDRDGFEMFCRCLAMQLEQAAASGDF